MTYDDIVKASKLLEALEPIPVAILVSPALECDITRTESIQNDGYYYYQGLRVVVDHTLTGSQYKIKYNKDK